MAPYIQLRTQKEHAWTACCCPVPSDPSKNPTPTETSRGLPKPCNYSILYLTTPAKTHLLLKIVPYSVLKGSIISDVLHLTWNKALLLPADYRVQPSQLSHCCAWGHGLICMQSLSGSLIQMLLTWLESSVVPIATAWKHFTSEMHLSSQTPLRKAVYPCYGEEKLKGITISRVSLDRVTQPLEEGAKTTAPPLLRLEPYHWPIESCAGLEVSCKHHTHFMPCRIYYPPFLFACFYQVSLNAKPDFQHGCVHTTASNWLSRFWKATAPDIHKTSELHFWTNIWILLPSVDISCFPSFYLLLPLPSRSTEPLN